MTDPIQEPTENAPSEAAPLDMKRSITKGVIGLGIFAIITAGMIALTQQMTADTIAEQIAIARSKALYEIVPASEHNNAILEESFLIDAQALGLSDLDDAYIAKLNGRPVSLILPVIAPAGYSGPIKLIVGIDTQGHIKGVRVVEHRETPGLGDKIELQKSDWIKSFDGLSLANTPSERWKVKKDGGQFDQLTGATITPRAIVHAILEALQFFEVHQQRLLAQTPQAVFASQTNTLSEQP